MKNYWLDRKAEREKPVGQLIIDPPVVINIKRLNKKKMLRIIATTPKQTKGGILLP